MADDLGYNLAQDATERLDLARQYPERVESMASEYASWAKAHGVLSPQEREPYQISPKTIENDSTKENPISYAYQPSE